MQLEKNKRDLLYLLTTSCAKVELTKSIKIFSFFAESIGTFLILYEVPFQLSNNTTTIIIASDGSRKFVQGIHYKTWI